MSTGKMGYWTWIDAIQMAMPVYSKMYKVTGERKYLDHAMKMYTWSRDTCGGGLFNTKEGLWWRDADTKKATARTAIGAVAADGCMPLW